MQCWMLVIAVVGSTASVIPHSHHTDPLQGTEESDSEETRYYDHWHSTATSRYRDKGISQHDDSDITHHGISDNIQHDSQDVIQHDIPAITQHSFHDITQHDIHDITQHDIPDITQHDIHDITQHDVPDITQHDIHDITQHDIPNITQHNIPNITQHNIHNITQHNIPNITQHNIPDITQQNIPDIAQHNIPDITQHNIPNITQYNIPTITQHNIPDITQHNIPDIAQHNIPDITQHNIPNITQYNIPTITQHNIPDITQHNIPNITQHNIPDITQKDFTATSQHDNIVTVSHNIDTPQQDFLASYQHGSSSHSQHTSHANTQHIVPSSRDHSTLDTLQHSSTTAPQHDSLPHWSRYSLPTDTSNAFNFASEADVRDDALQLTDETNVIQSSAEIIDNNSVLSPFLQANIPERLKPEAGLSYELTEEGTSKTDGYEESANFMENVLQDSTVSYRITTAAVELPQLNISAENLLHAETINVLSVPNQNTKTDKVSRRRRIRKKNYIKKALKKHSTFSPAKVLSQEIYFSLGLLGTEDYSKLSVDAPDVTKNSDTLFSPSPSLPPPPSLSTLPTAPPYSEAYDDVLNITVSGRTLHFEKLRTDPSQLTESNTYRYTYGGDVDVPPSQNTYNLNSALYSFNQKNTMQSSNNFHNSEIRTTLQQLPVKNGIRKDSSSSHDATAKNSHVRRRNNRKVITLPSKSSQEPAWLPELGDRLDSRDPRAGEALQYTVTTTSAAPLLLSPAYLAPPVAASSAEPLPRETGGVGPPPGYPVNPTQTEPTAFERQHHTWKSNQQASWRPDAGYQYGYGVADETRGTHFGHVEKRNDVSTQGKYFTDLPDGRRMTVTYFADHTGYHPTVTYELSPNSGHNNGRQVALPSQLPLVLPQHIFHDSINFPNVHYVITHTRPMNVPLLKRHTNNHITLGYEASNCPFIPDQYLQYSTAPYWLNNCYDLYDYHRDTLVNHSLFSINISPFSVSESNIGLSLPSFNRTFTSNNTNWPPLTSRAGH